MKNLLMGASVAALSLTAFQASAQNFDFRIDGFFTGGLGYIDGEASAGGFDDDDNFVVDTEDDEEFALVRDAEIHFLGQVVSDNGLTFGSTFELEAIDTAGGGDAAYFDEVYMFVTGPFGTFELGEEDGAQDFAGTALVTAPFASAQDEGGLLFDFFTGPGVGGLDSTGFNSGDSLKISYFTPNFSGFSAGVSYIPDFGQENGRATTFDVGVLDDLGFADEDEIEDNDALEIGAGYGGEFGGAEIAAGVGYTEIFENDNGDSLGGSLSAGFGGFIVGASYAWVDAGGDDLQTIGGGVGYETGPWAIGADAAWNFDGSQGLEDDWGTAIGASYALAPGVLAGATVEYSVDENDFGTLADEDSSIAVGTWLGFAF